MKTETKNNIAKIIVLSLIVIVGIALINESLKDLYDFVL